MTAAYLEKEKDGKDDFAIDKCADELINKLDQMY